MEKRFVRVLSTILRAGHYALEGSRVFDTQEHENRYDVDDLYAKFLEVFGVARTHGMVRTNYLKATPSWVLWRIMEFLSGDSDRRSWRAHRFRLRARSCEGCGGTRLLPIAVDEVIAAKRISVIDIFHAPRQAFISRISKHAAFSPTAVRSRCVIRYSRLRLSKICATTRCNRSQTLAASSVEHIVDIIGEAVKNLDESRLSRVARSRSL